RLYPEKKRTAIFQPHLYGRTRGVVDDFAEVLGVADELWLMEIYPARELPMAGVNSKWLLVTINLKTKYVMTLQEILERSENEKPELIVTMGAGDIERLVKPIKKILENI